MTAAAVTAMAAYQGLARVDDVPLPGAELPLLCFARDKSTALVFAWFERLTTAQHGPLKAAVARAGLARDGRAYVMTSTPQMCRCASFSCGSMCRTCERVVKLLGVRVTLLSATCGLGVFLANGVDMLACMRDHGFLLDVPRPVKLVRCRARTVFSKSLGLDALHGASFEAGKTTLHEAVVDSRRVEVPNASSTAALMLGAMPSAEFSLQVAGDQLEPYAPQSKAAPRPPPFVPHSPVLRMRTATQHTFTPHSPLIAAAASAAVPTACGDDW